MARVSLKFVVAALLFVTTAVTSMCVILPIMAQMQPIAVKFVSDACQSAAVFLQQDFSSWQHRTELACALVRQAAMKKDFLAPGYDPADFLQWAASAITNLGPVDIMIGTADGHGMRIATYGFTATEENSSIPYGDVINFTAPGEYYDHGLFQLQAPYLPANATQPWSRVPQVNLWTQSAWGQALVNISLPTGSPMRWAPAAADVVVSDASASPLSSRQTAESAMVFGGSILTVNHRRQFLSLTVRGQYTSLYFNTLPDPSASIVIIMFDAVTMMFMAGNVADLTGRILADGTAAGVLLRELQDLRVRSMLSAPAAAVAGGATVPGDVAFSTCRLPCEFVFWPHLNEFRDSPATTIDAFFHAFVAVRVVAARKPRAGEHEVRFIVLQPSTGILHAYVRRMQASIVGFCFSLGVCIVMTIVVAILFRCLDHIEGDVLSFAKALAAPPSAPEAKFRLRRTTSVVRDFDRLFKCLHKLSLEVIVMRAFSSTSSIVANGRVDSSTQETSPTHSWCGGGVPRVEASASDSTCVDGANYGEANSVGPRESSTKREERSPPLRRQPLPGYLTMAPVTTVTARMAPEYLASATSDPLAIHERHSAVFAVLHKQVHKTPGADIAFFYGDRVLIHFNARGRTRDHALVAVDTCSQCSRAFSNEGCQQGTTRDEPIVFGIATSTAICGPLGPPQFQSYSVLGAAVSQSWAMCGIAASQRLPIIVTRHVMELASQAQQLQRNCESPTFYTFAAAARTVLAGEQALGLTPVFGVVWRSRSSA